MADFTGNTEVSDNHRRKTKRIGPQPRLMVLWSEEKGRHKTGMAGLFGSMEQKKRGMQIEYPGMRAKGLHQ